MSKHGRPQLSENELNRDKRRVCISNRDWARVDACCQIITDDAWKSVNDASGKLSATALPEIVGLFVQLAEEKNRGAGEKSQGSHCHSTCAHVESGGQPRALQRLGE